MAVDARTVETAGISRWAGMRLGRAMTLVAFVAVGLTFLRMNASMVLERIDLGLPYLAEATLVLVAVRLWRPHPPLERLLREPGFLACGIASVLLVAATVGSFALGVVGKVIQGSGSWGPSRGDFQSMFRSLSDWGYLVGLSVLVSWVVLGAVRGWRAEPTVADRAGRAIGWAWVLLTPAAIVLRLTIILVNLMG